MALQAGDIRLRPQLLAACSEEVAVFCKGVEPGGLVVGGAWAAVGASLAPRWRLQSRPWAPVWLPADYAATPLPAAGKGRVYKCLTESMGKPGFGWVLMHCFCLLPCSRKAAGRPAIHNPAWERWLPRPLHPLPPRPPAQ